MEATLLILDMYAQQVKDDKKKDTEEQLSMKAESSGYKPDYRSHKSQKFRALICY